MRKLNFTFLVVVACLFALAASAADVSGTYVAQVPGRNGAMETTFKLKADGDKLTGTVVTQRGEAEIKDGKVELTTRATRTSEDVSIESAVESIRAKLDASIKETNLFPSR